MDLIRSLTCVSASHLRLVRDDDSHVDRLSHRYTVIICVIFAIIVTTKQYAGDPIDCWVPAQFKASYEKYADSYCWIAGSWYTPMDKELPLSERERRQNRIRYYQWVPFLLLFQAILCYIPRIIWRTLNVRSGLDIVNLVDAAIKYESVDKFCDREKIMEYIVKNVERYIGARRSRYERLYGRQLCAMHNSNMNQQQRNTHYKTAPRSPLTICCCKCWIRIKIVLSTICFWTGKRLGNYLVVLYMFVKTLWLTNAVSQLFLLNRFIGNDYHAFGVEIIEMLLSGQEWHELRHFPRVTYCDFKIREIGNQHDWTVQCVLRINLFNEVIYIFMWFWLCILALCSLVDYLTWTLRILIPRDKLRFVKRHLDVDNFYAASRKNQVAGKSSKSGKHHHHGSKSTNVARTSNVMQEPEYNNNFDYVDYEKEKKLIREFTFSYLKDDGIFALRIMASSASDLIVTEIVGELWKNFKLNYSENTDEITLVSSPSSASSTSSNSSSNQSSAVPSVVSSPSCMAPTNQLSNLKMPSSPSSIIKKPFTGYQPPQPKPYSPNNLQQQQQQQQYQQQQQQQLPIYSNPNNNNTMKANQTSSNSPPPAPISSNLVTVSSHQSNPHQPPPPLLPPQSTIPQQTTTDESVKRPGNNTGTLSSKENIYPQLQQRHVHHEITNANPNAKDTHV